MSQSITAPAAAYDNFERCPVCLEHPGWAHDDTTRRDEPRDVCRACLGSGSASPLR